QSVPDYRYPSGGAFLVMARSAFPLFMVMLMMSGPTPAQELAATVRVEVICDSAPVAHASVSVGGKTGDTDTNGIVSLPTALGTADIAVTKEGFLPAKTRVTVDEPREWRVTIELKAAEARKEQVTVSATRTDARLQDVPTRVETLDQDEIEEKTMMTPGDIVMLLNEMGGLRVQTTSPSLGAASVRIQGMRGR